MARIAFCQNIMVEFMGCMSMSAALKLAGHEVEVFIDSGVRSGRFFSQVRDFRPDIAGFSVLTPSAPWALAAAERIKTENRCVAVFGNVHAIIQPEIIGHPGVDAVCRGEGEAPLVEMAGRLNRGLPFDDIPGLWVKTGGGVRKNPPAGDVLDLDSLPDHDRALYDKYSIFRRSRYLRFLLGRGCPHNCTYCTNAYMKAHYGPGYVRKRAPERAVAELERLVAERHPEIINFIDEVLWVNNEWLVKFLRLYKERIGLPFAANYRHGAIREEEVRLMAEAGCRHLVLAVESDEGKRLGLLGKRVTDAQILQAGALLRKYNIGMISHVLFGLPGDTVEGHLAQLPFFRKLDADYLWTSFFQPEDSRKSRNGETPAGKYRFQRNVPPRNGSGPSGPGGPGEPEKGVFPDDKGTGSGTGPEEADPLQADVPVQPDLHRPLFDPRVPVREDNGLAVRRPHDEVSTRAAGAETVPRAGGFPRQINS